ncbi:MAG: DNA polymerase/3'-5' exonuclease PolX [Thermoanaerobaculia bacterium]
MDKWGIARELSAIADYLEISDSNPFKSAAFRKAARAVEGLSGDVAALVRSGEIRNVQGIGKATGAVIEDIMSTGRSSYLEELKSQFPPGVLELMEVPGLGAKKIGELHAKLGISSVTDLEAACRAGRLATLKGFGKKTEEKILEGIAFLQTTEARVLLPTAIEISERLAARLRELDGVTDAVICGQVRRRLEVVDRIAICVIARRPGVVIDTIREHALLEGAEVVPGVMVRGSGPGSLPVEVQVVTPKDAPSAVFALTGSAEFLEAFARRASKKKLTLDGIAMLRDGETFTPADERAIFAAAGVAFVEPELREGGVTLAARSRRTLVDASHLRGTFHMHTTYSDGRATLREMLDAAHERGLSYAGISDHSKAAAYAGGLTEERLNEQQADIERERASSKDLTIFRGTEADILQDGSIDYGHKTLEQFDFVVASVHSRFKLDRDAMTDRIVRALTDPFVTFLGHMTGRLLLSRPGYDLDFDRIFETAAKHGVIIEINGSPQRLDIDWRLIPRAASLGVLFAINPDAHSTREMGYLDNGTWVARKGGLEPEQIFNTRPVEEVADYLRARRKRAIAAS